MPMSTSLTNNLIAILIATSNIQITLQKTTQRNIPTCSHHAQSGRRLNLQQLSVHALSTSSERRIRPRMVGRVLVRGPLDTRCTVGSISKLWESSWLFVDDRADRSIEPALWVSLLHDVLKAV
jgi:hypothetical protein